MRKWLIVTIAAIAMMFCATNVDARPLSLNEISQAVCRVKAGTTMKSAGTGTCIGETPDGSAYYVLTNAHVVDNHKTAKLEFFKGGYISKQLTANVEWRAYQRGSDVDFAILTVTKAQFGEHPPRIIPLAPEGYRPTTGHYIAAAGCPSARWVQSWEGHITMDRSSRILFAPAPVGGQSGSGITVLVQGKDGEWYTRVGAVLTWRIGENSNVQGGAIPVSTLYNVMRGTHAAYEVPVSYTEVAAKYALGSDGKHYRIYLDSSGNKTVRMDNPNVNIISWRGCGRPNCPAGCGSSGSPSWGSNPWGAPHPNPSPDWRRPSPTPTPTPTPGNPYGVNPPSIGAPWPGTTEKPKEEPKQEPEVVPQVPVEPEKPEIPEVPENPLPPLSQELDELGQKYNKLAQEKKAIQDKLDALEADILAQATKDQDAERQRLEEEREAALAAKAKAEAEAAAAAAAEEAAKAKAAAEAEEEVAEETPPPTFIGRVKEKINGFFGGVLMASGIGIVVLIWNKFLRKKLIQKIDNIQDFIQARLEKKWGKALAAEARDAMEGAEDALLGVADDFLEDLQARKQVAKSNIKGKIASRITNGSAAMKKVSTKQVIAAVEEAANEVGDDGVTTEVPKKVEEILKKVSEDKSKAV